MIPTTNKIVPPLKSVSGIGAVSKRGDICRSSPFSCVFDNIDRERWYKFFNAFSLFFHDGINIVLVYDLYLVL